MAYVEDLYDIQEVTNALHELFAGSGLQVEFEEVYIGDLHTSYLINLPQPEQLAEYKPLLYDAVAELLGTTNFTIEAPVGETNNQMLITLLIPYIESEESFFDTIKSYFQSWNDF